METYWKSMALPRGISSISQTSLPWRQSPRSLDSTHTSPSIHPDGASPSRTLTLSSLVGNHMHVIVQVTRDLHPVIFSDYLLPEAAFDLGVSDVTLEQFQALAGRVERDDKSLSKAASMQEWSRMLSHCMVSLADVMQVGHLSSDEAEWFFESIQFADSSDAPRPYVRIGSACQGSRPWFSQTPNRPERVRRLRIAHDPRSDLFRFGWNICPSPDRIHVILASSLRSTELETTKLSVQCLFFASFDCGSLELLIFFCFMNLDPVFFSSQCGQIDQGSRALMKFHADGVGSGCRYWSSSVAAGVDFAKRNNLLGVFFDPRLLVRWRVCVGALYFFLTPRYAIQATGSVADPRNQGCWPCRWVLRQSVDVR